MNGSAVTTAGRWAARQAAGARRALSSAAAPAAKGEKRPAPARQSTSFMLNLFRGQLEPAQVFPYPDVLNPDQRQVLTELVPPVERFFEEVNNPAKNDADSQVEPKTLEGLWELGAFGLQVPSDLGGLGLSNSQYARLVEIVGANDLGVGITLGAHQSIGFKGILLFGTPEQKEKYLPRVTGGEFAAFCLTEPGSGSDAGSIKTRAVLSPDGKHWIMNGSKIWISNGGIAEVMTVFAQTPVEKDGKTVDKVTAFIVERSFGGVSSGPPEHKMGIRCSNTTEVYYEDVKIPVENVLGGVGNGFKVAMNILNNGRFGMAAALAGTQRSAIKQAAEHAAARTQFGKKLIEFGSVKERLARMARRQYATESLAYLVAGNMDAGFSDYHVEAAIAKVFASESAWRTVDDAIQLLGGMGFMVSAGLERVLRDLRIFRIFEGTNDILRLFVALTGIQYAGSHLSELQRAFKSPTANLGLIFSEAGRRATRAVGLTRQPTIEVVPELQNEAREMAKLVTSYGATVESVLTRHGRGVVDQQHILNRLADSAADTYTSAAVLSRATRAAKLGLPTAENEIKMAAAWCDSALSRAVKSQAAAAEDKAHKTSLRLQSLGVEIAKNPLNLAVNPLGV